MTSDEGISWLATGIYKGACPLVPAWGIYKGSLPLFVRELFSDASSQNR